MSYARWSKSSSVYVYSHVGGGIDCCGCPNSKGLMTSDEEVVAHFKAHTDAGDTVPPYMVDNILEDSASDPDFYKPSRS